MQVAILALVLTVCALLIYVFGSAGAAHYQLEKRFKSAGIISTHADYTNKAMELPLYSRLINPLLLKISDLFHSITPQSLHIYVAKKLQEAGATKTVDIRPFLLRWGLVMLMLLMLAPVVSYYIMQLSFPGVLIGEAVAAGFGLVLPVVVLRSQIRTRKAKISRDLPDIIDLLLVSIQAGNSFDAAISRVSEQMKGPLVDELATLQQQIRVGLARREAFDNFSARCNVVDVSLLVAAIVQSEHLGVSIAKVMEVQSQALRKKRVLRAREAAMKAAVKLLLPLVLFILPVLFLAILAPAAISILQTMNF